MNFVKQFLRSLWSCKAAFLVLCAVLACFHSLHAQPEQVAKAEAVFAEALLLSSHFEAEHETEVTAKFDEAATLFRNAGNGKRAGEVDLQHGKYLKNLGIRDLNADKLTTAQSYFDKALSKLRPLAAHLELAYVYHNIGFIAAKSEKYDEAKKVYGSARTEYAIAGDRDGEATVLRNLGVIHYNQQNFALARASFASALNIRIAMRQLEAQALLQTDLGDCERQLKHWLVAASRYELALATYRKAKSRKGEAEAHVRLGELYNLQFNYAPAAKNLTAAQQIYTEIEDWQDLAETVEKLGSLHLAYSKYAEAERSLRLASEMYKILGQKNNEGTVSLDLAVALKSQNRTEEARAVIDRARVCFKEGDSLLGDAYALIIDADFLSYLNKHDEALANIKAAEKMFLENPGSGSGKFRIARAYSDYYYYLSNYGETIRYGQIALAEAEKDGHDYRIASSLLNLTNAYSALGQNQRSITLLQRTHVIARKIGSRYLESIVLSNIGYDYFLIKKLPQAESNFRRAIAIMHADDYEREEGYALNNLGLVYFQQKKFALARSNYDRALALYQKAGDRRPEAFIYQNYGELYRELGDLDKAADYLQRAILLSREIRYSDVEAKALAGMMSLWNKRGQSRLAILYGKQAVNVYQSIRSGNRTLDKDSQKSYMASHETSYRELANLLIDDGRLGEAQQVLDLLKEEEFLDFVRRDASEAVDQAKLALTDPERKALDEYTRLSSQLTSLGTRFQALQDAKTKADGKLSPADEAEFQSLKTQIEEAGVGVRTFLSKLSQEFSKKVEDDAIITPASIEALRASLRSAGPDVVLVSTYLLPNRYRAIVTTGRTMVDRKVEYADQKLSQSIINRKISEFQRALQNPRVDPRPLGKELYDIFVKPLEVDLDGAKAKTILWSLDGTLRYIPMAALSPDGKTYLAEKYQNVIVTLARQTNLFAKPAADEWRALGAGVSKPHEGFSALPSVINELNSIVRENGTTGVLDGKKLVDESFDLNSLRATLPQTTDDGKPFNVVHLATHFKLGSNDQESALLLGDGKRLSLFEINKDEELDFKDVELLALSACETGVSADDGSGREVESLGMLAQKKGAKAVLATLWKIADEGTSMFMSEFYRLKKADPKLSKAEAIRLTQKEMIDGKIKSTGLTGGCRAEDFGSGGKPNAFKCDPNAPFSHPYFWSPFILIGNWR